MPWLISSRRALGLVLWLSMLPATILAQNQILDSLKIKLEQTQGAPRVKILTDLAWYAKDKHLFTQAEAYAWQAIELAEGYQDLKGKGNAWNVLGLIDFNRSLYDSAELYFDSALVVFRQTLDTTGQIAVLNNMGQMLGTTGRCIEALPMFKEAISILRAQKKDARRRIYSLRLNQITALMFCYHYQTAQKLGLELLGDLEKEEDEFLQIKGILNDMIGVVLIELNQAAQALPYLYRAEEIMLEIEHPYGANVVRSNQGMALVQLERYEEAIALFEETRHKNGEVMINDGVSEMNLATALVKVGRHQEALNLALDGIDRIVDRGEIAPLPRAYRALAEAYAGVGDSAAAYNPLMRAMTLNDSLKSVQIASRVQELNAEFETERFSYALEKAELEIRLNRQRIFLLTSVLGAVVLLGAIAYLVFFMRVKRRFYEAQQRQTELEYSVLRTQMNPHFIFNALNSIQGFFADQDFIRGNEYLGAFAFLMRKVLNQSAQKEISLEEELETLKLYLELEQARLGQQLTYDIQVDPAVESAWMMIPPLILQPFVENAVWHGIAPKAAPGHIRIDIKVNEAETHLLCRIIDDGVGLGQTSGSAHESKGIHITQERLGEAGTVSIANRQDAQGVEVRLKIPV